MIMLIIATMEIKHFRLNSFDIHFNTHSPLPLWLDFSITSLSSFSSCYLFPLFPCTYSFRLCLYIFLFVFIFSFLSVCFFASISSPSSLSLSLYLSDAVSLSSSPSISLFLILFLYLPSSLYLSNTRYFHFPFTFSLINTWPSFSSLRFFRNHHSLLTESRSRFLFDFFL